MLPSFVFWRRLRGEPRHRPVVVVRVVDPVGVHLEHAVVEVDVRGVRELAGHGFLLFFIWFTELRLLQALYFM